jgi:plasmid maintenance system antidote protein VapI
VQETTKQQLLRRAGTLLGRESLASDMGVSPDQLDAWINGDATMPDRQLIKLAKILDQHANKNNS